MSKVISIRLDDAAYEKIEVRATAEGKTVTELAREMVCNEEKPSCDRASVEASGKLKELEELEVLESNVRELNRMVLATREKLMDLPKAVAAAIAPELKIIRERQESLKKSAADLPGILGRAIHENSPQTEPGKQDA